MEGVQDAGVSVSTFNDSVDDFLNQISALCVATGQDETFEDSEIQRFSPMITFLKEWTYFHYESKTVNFAYQTGYTEAQELMKGISLPQFSSAAVPKMGQLPDQLPDETMLGSHDFVLHAGGPVWALDWCPRIPTNSNNNIKCEYLAVAAHPPGSAYHKIGLPLVGRGVIQVWCLVNIDEKVEHFPPGQKHRGLGKKKPSEKKTLNGLSCEKQVPMEKKPRGRPRKIEVGELPTAKRPRGRPRKAQVEEEALPSCKEPVNNLRCEKQVSTAKRPRGRPKKITIEESPLHGSDYEDILYLPSSKEPLKKLRCEKLVSTAKKPRGRPKKIIVDEKSLYGSDYEDILYLPGKQLGVTAEPTCDDQYQDPTVSCEEMMSTKEPLNNLRREKQASTAKKPRGGPKKINVEEKPLYENFSEDILSLPDKQSGITAEPTCDGHYQDPMVPCEEMMSSKEPLNNFRCEKQVSSAKKPRGRPKKINVEEKPLYGSDSEDILCLPGKQSGVTAEPTCDGHYQDPTVPCEEMMSSKEPLNNLRCEKQGSATKNPRGRLKKINVEEKPLYENNNEDRSHLPDKQLGVTAEPAEPTFEDHYQDRMVPCDEGIDSRLTDANTTTSNYPKSIALPRIVLCLAHNGKVAWDAKWRPFNDNTSEGKGRMGYLAVLLGNGSLEVWEVPLPSMVKILYTSCRREGTDPRFLKLNPVFRCSKVKCGDRQSIPLTVEWSPSGPCDLILAGCHDGTVALWKFSTHCSSQDTKPLLCFTADSVPIRALAWSPEESDVESANLIVTAGHEGLKFWDIRDPYRPLWDFNPVKGFILSMDWIKDPRSIILSYDDGTLRTISLWKIACDVPVTGKHFTGTKPAGVHLFGRSSSAIWSVQVSRATGLVSYCGADGSALHFQLTANAVEKDAGRYRQPHFLCGSVIEEGQALTIVTPLPNSPLSDIPFSLKKSLSDHGGGGARTIASYLSDAKQTNASNSQFPGMCPGEEDQSMDFGSGDSQPPPIRTLKPISNSKKKGQASLPQEPKIEVFPPKIVAMHRVRWNMNRGSERWLCYGGAAGIIRCQAVRSPVMS